MKVLLVGTGGYASLYVRALLKTRELEWVGAVDPYFRDAKLHREIEAAGIPVFDTMEEFYARQDADLAVIATPPFLHTGQSLTALAHGSFVLSEKPAAPTVAEVELMIEAERRTGKFIAIGYQWSFSDAIRRLKQDILSGRLGRPLSMKTFISWPRDKAYYARGTGWAGRIRRGNTMVLDSIASNACAHYLHNMLFLLGDTMETSRMADTAEAALYRAYPIENFDTAAISFTAGGVRCYFAASHTADRVRDPEFVYTFEKAVVRFSQAEGSRILADFADGTTVDYGDPFARNEKKLFDCAAAVKDGTVPICTAGTALAHTALIGKLYEEAVIRSFPRSAICEDEKRITVPGLYEKLYEAYQNEALPQF